MATAPHTVDRRPDNARWLLVVTVLGAWALSVLLLILYVDRRDKPSSPSASAAGTAAVASFPAPPAGAVVFSREAGPNALAIGVVPGSNRTRVQASVVGPDGVGLSDLSTTLSLDGAKAAGTACGAGCYRADFPAGQMPRSVGVSTEGSLTTRWRASLPTGWPPEDAAAMLARSRHVWRTLRSLSFTERLASDPKHVVVSTWRAEAPDRLAYEVAKSYSAIVVGSHRWDKGPRGRWKRSTQVPLEQPTPPWSSATDAHVLRATKVGGRRALRVSFYDPKTPAWFAITLDRKTLRTLDLRMITTAHFMHETYGQFNAAPEIRAPVQP
jgi:hypothetical protein